MTNPKPEATAPTPPAAATPSAPQAEAAAAPVKEKRTKPAAIAEGRDRFAMDHASAVALAEATTKAGFPVPARVQAVIDAGPQTKTEA